MDDLFIFAQDARIFQWLKKTLCERFSMTNFGDVQFILGLHLMWDISLKSIILNQSNDIASLLTVKVLNGCM
jgi:hypothetical protein